MIKKFKLFEELKQDDFKNKGQRIPLGSGKYKLGDYILIPGPLKNSYTKIAEVRNSSFADYMIVTYDIITGNILERFPVMENEIIRKLTTEEIEEIEIKRKAIIYNL